MEAETFGVQPKEVYSDCSAFTLIEVIAALLIILIIAALVVPNFDGWLGRAEQAKCMANMRSVQLGLNGYLNDNNQVWPQGPAPTESDAWAQFWVRTLEPYGVAAATWRCPAITRLMGKPGGNEVTGASVHYTPTMFDAQRGSAHRWPTQPWLVERADVHGQGALISFPDGSIKPFNKVLAEQGMR